MFSPFFDLYQGKQEMVLLYAVMPHTNVERALEVAMTLDVPFDNLFAAWTLQDIIICNKKAPQKVGLIIRSHFCDQIVTRLKILYDNESLSQGLIIVGFVNKP